MVTHLTHMHSYITHHMPFMYTRLITQTCTHYISFMHTLMSFTHTLMSFTHTLMPFTHTLMSFMHTSHHSYITHSCTCHHACVTHLIRGLRTWSLLNFGDGCQFCLSDITAKRMWGWWMWNWCAVMWRCCVVKWRVGWRMLCGDVCFGDVTCWMTSCVVTRLVMCCDVKCWMVCYVSYLASGLDDPFNKILILSHSLMFLTYERAHSFEIEWQKW